MNFTRSLRTSIQVMLVLFGLLGSYLLLANMALAQSTRAQLTTQNNSIIQSNGVGAITGTKLNTVLNAGIQSYATLLDNQTLTGINTFSQNVILPGMVLNGTTITGVNSAGNIALLNGSIVSGNCLKWSATGIQDAGAVCGSGGGGSGTVTNIATTAPLSGGPITTTGTISITGAAGQVLAGAGPAFTATPTLGVAGSTVGTLAFANATSGSITLQPVTGALGSAVLSLPAATDTLIGKATTDALTNKTFNTAATGNVFQINGTGITAISGTGSVCMTTSCAMTTPNLGTPSAVTLTNGTGLPIGGLTGLGTGVATALGNAVTGSGGIVLATSPTLVTPTLGVASATTINKVILTAPATGSTLTIADGKTLTASNTMIFAATDGQTWTFPASSSNVLTTGNTATITKGYTATPASLGNMTNFSLDCTAGNLQFGTDHAAVTITMQTSDCAIDLLVTNDATAGAISFSGFTVGASTGDALTTTNTNKFIISFIRINGVGSYWIKALQ